MSENDRNDPSGRKPQHLLDELESIKGLLGNADADDARTNGPGDDIPLLDDMVIEHLDDNSALLNLNQIFEEPDVAPGNSHDVIFPSFRLDVAISDAPASSFEPSPPAAAPPPRPRVRPDYRRELLIQELVDELVPQIEAALRLRLQQLDTDALQQLKSE